MNVLWWPKSTFSDYKITQCCYALGYTRDTHRQSRSGSRNTVLAPPSATPPVSRGVCLHGSGSAFGHARRSRIRGKPTYLLVITDYPRSFSENHILADGACGNLHCKQLTSLQIAVCHRQTTFLAVLQSSDKHQLQSQTSFDRPLSCVHNPNSRVSVHTATRLTE